MPLAILARPAALARALLRQARERGYHVSALCAHPKSSAL